MAAKNSPILLYIGVIFILGAVGLFVVSLLDESAPSATRSKAAAKARSKAAAETKAAAVPEPVDTLEQRLEEERRHRQEMTLILLEQIKSTPGYLNLAWLAEFCTYITSESKLAGFFDRVLETGVKREKAYVAKQRSEGKVVPNNSLYYIELARKEIYGTRPTESALETSGQYLAMSLYREAQQKEGLEKVDTEFMSTYFKEALKIAAYGLELAVTKRDSIGAMKELVTVHEASLMEAQSRVERNEAMLREKRQGTAMSAASGLLRIGKISMRVNSGLLALGKIYLEAAERETVSRRKLQYNAEHAFAAFAMVYQLTTSGEALNAIRQVNDIQRGYLHRMARLSWKNAKVAAQGGDWKQADEHLFVATQRYLQAMARAGEARRAKIRDEFERFKQDIAELKSKKSGTRPKQQS